MKTTMSEIVTFEQTDIVSFIEQYIELTEYGVDSRPYLSGLCPFHDDVHASFYIYPNIQRWICYPCLTGYCDLLEFVRRYFGENGKKLSFIEAKKKCCIELTPEDAIARSLKFQTLEENPEVAIYNLRIYDMVESMGLDSLPICRAIDVAIAANNYVEADNILRRRDF